MFNPHHQDQLNLIKNKYKGVIVEGKTLSLNTIQENTNAPQYIDFLKIDIEGFEYQALKTFNFDKYKVKIILAEGNPKTSPLLKLLADNDFVYKDAKDNNLLFVHKAMELQL